MAVRSQAHDGLQLAARARDLQPALDPRRPDHPPAAATPGRGQHFIKPDPLRVGDTTYYPFRFEGHIHTLRSPDARHPPLKVLEWAEQGGLDAVVITDHGSSAAQHEFAQYTGKLVPFIGREIGGDFGHAVYWNVTDDDDSPADTTSLKQRAAFAHAHGGLIVLAHPGWWISGNTHNPMEWMTAKALRKGGTAGDVDAIEIWNGVYRTPLKKLVAVWVDLLEAHVYVPIVGNSDFHSVSTHQLGSAHNVAWCTVPEPSKCLWPAVRSGQLVVTDGSYAALRVDNRLPGAVVPTSSRPLRVDVDAMSPDGGTLSVYLGKQVVQTLELARGVAQHASWQIAAPAQDSFVRIDIVRPPGTRAHTSITLLSNPVLLDAGKHLSWR
jgi:hypothetical protein